MVRYSKALTLAALMVLGGGASAPATAESVEYVMMNRVFVGTRDDRGQARCVRELKSAQRYANAAEARFEDDYPNETISDGPDVFCEFSRKGKRRTRLQIIAQIAY